MRLMFGTQMKIILSLSQRNEEMKVNNTFFYFYYYYFKTQAGL